MRKAEVFCHDIKAGILTEEVPGKNYTFTYEKLYLADASHEPISVTMPLREEPYHSEYLFPFFTNMLPEGANRKIVCRSWRLDEKDFFGLLLKIATFDTIGAVTVKDISE
ncbi:MAG: HipA N-terminal domain-containing protein [Prevotella sp.]|uniref:HipA N-terminal domain-containing protein n=1 Tax=Prevotella sp. TaxID=59823 RepID=UPI0025E356ED|nr:HipA N-terminal domain-containing protein [Prevotella sp.]